VIWRFDMREELGVFPHNITNCGPLIIGDKIVVTTSNGVDWGHTNIPNPKAPALCMLDKKTGALLGEEGSGVSSRTLHSNWSSPAGGKIGNKDLIVFGGGDGICYGLDTETVKKDDVNLFKELWRYDCNPPQYRVKNGKPSSTPRTPARARSSPHPSSTRTAFTCPSGRTPSTARGWVTSPALTPQNRRHHQNGHDLDLQQDRPFAVHAFHRGRPRLRRRLQRLRPLPRRRDRQAVLGLRHQKPHLGFDARRRRQGVRRDRRWRPHHAPAGKDKGRQGAQGDQPGGHARPVYSSPVVANGVLYVATPTHLYAIGKPK
jgi:hypothetical protein